jgi:UDP-N-acetylmuramate--alanine ligase
MFFNKQEIMYTKKFHVHFIGIGGIGMSALARLLLEEGYTVSGCDSSQEQKNILQLKALGCTITPHNHNSCKKKSINTIVYSTAIDTENPELLAAKEHGIPCIHRSQLLAELMQKKYSIAVTGSHGKTTTSSLIAHLLIEANIDPTAIIGGIIHSIGSNARHGKSNILVAEADESDRSLLNLYPSLAVLTNISLEHLETYTNLHDIVHTFAQFLERLPFYGKAFVCIENPHVKTLLPLKNNQAITYGLNSTADWYATNIIHHSDSSTYDAYFKNTFLGAVNFAMPGIHNLLNSLASLAVGTELGIPFTNLANGLNSFTGVDRRFTYKGTYQGATIFDDYGHHPTEIKHALTVARKKTTGKLTMLFQPHRYTRTQRLWNEFVDLFANYGPDKLILTDIFAASEKPLKNITSLKLLTSIKERNPKLEIAYVPLKKDLSELKKIISENISEGDLLLLQGAGKINTIADFLLHK